MQSEKQANNGKALVVYYSRSGNTEAVARMIGNETGADLFRVTTVKPYPEEYRAATEQARAERDSNARPAINGRVEALAAYDVVYGGGGVANCVSDLKKAVPNAKVLEAFVVSGSNAANAQSDVRAWLQRLGLTK